MKLRTWLLVLEAALFVYAGICCFSLVSFIAEDFGSKFALFARYLPYTLMNIIPIHLLLVLHFALHPYSLKHKRWMLILNGAFICLGGFLMALLTAVYSFKGTYSSIVMGGITSLYPLDALILGLLYSLLGFALYFYGLKKYQGKNDRFPDPKPRRVWRILIGIFGSLFLLTALFFMGDLALFFYTLDYSLSNWWEMLSFYLLMALPAVELGFYVYGYKECQDPTKAQYRQFHYAVAMAGSALAVSIFFFIAMIVNPLFLMESGMALLPIDFMNSIPVGPVSLLASAYAAPLVAFLLFLRPKKKKGPETKDSD